MDAANTEWIGNDIQWAPYDYTSIANIMVDCLIRNNAEILRLSSEIAAMQEEFWTLRRQNIELQAKVDNVFVAQLRNRNDECVQCVNGNGDHFNSNTSSSSAVHGTSEIVNLTTEVSGTDDVETSETGGRSNARTKGEIIPSFAASKHRKPKIKRRSYRGCFPKYGSAPVKPLFFNERNNYRVVVIYCFFRWTRKCSNTQSVSDDDGVNDGDDDDERCQRFTIRAGWWSGWPIVVPKMSTSKYIAIIFSCPIVSMNCFYY